MKRVLQIFSLILLIGLIGFGVYWFLTYPISVASTVVQRQTLIMTQQEQGTVKSRSIKTYTTEVTDVVEEVYVQVGQEVKTGDKLAKIRSETIDDMLAEQRAQRNLIESEWSRRLDDAEKQMAALRVQRAQAGASSNQKEQLDIQINLVEKSMDPLGESGEAKYYRSLLEQVDLKITQLTRQKESTNIVAVAPGAVQSLNIVVGQTVQAGTALLDVADTDQVSVLCEVSADDIALFGTNTPVTIVWESGSETIRYAGKIKYISSISTSATATQGLVNVEVTPIFPENQPRPKLGYKVNALFNIKEIHDVLSVPLDAVLHVGDRSYVWKIDGGFLSKVAVTLGEKTDQMIVVDGEVSGKTIVNDAKTPGLREGRRARTQK